MGPSAGLLGCRSIPSMLIRAGEACAAYHDEHVQRPGQRVQCDEIWSFVYAKQKTQRMNIAQEDAGDVWTWTAIDGRTWLGAGMGAMPPSSWGTWPNA